MSEKNPYNNPTLAKRMESKHIDDLVENFIERYMLHRVVHPMPEHEMEELVRINIMEAVNVLEACRFNPTTTISKK